MSCFIFVICILICILTFFYKRNIYNPTSIFCIWWGLIVFISGIGMFDIYIPSNKTYTIILLSIFGFCIGNLFVDIITNLKKQELNSLEYNISESKFTKNKSYKLLYMLNYISLIFLLYMLYNVVRLLLNGEMYSNIRLLLYYSNSILKNQIDKSIYAYILEPIIYFDMILIAMISFNKNITIKLKILVVANILMYAFTTGARTVIFYPMCLLIIRYLIINKHIKVKFTKKIWFYIGIGFIIGFLIIMTYARGVETDNPILNLIESLVIYFTSSIKFLEIKLDSFHNNNTFFYGFSFIGGLYGILVSIFNFILGLNLINPTTIIGIESQISEIVGNTIAYNAFPTMIYSFAYDFGIEGIIIGSILFGVIANILYYKFTYRKNLINCGYYLIIVFAIIESTLRWSLSFIWPYISFGILMLINKIEKS